ncbi:MAG: caspase family protein [Bacteroidales bacterium]|nr:caspase family protein [Bacteroidales bacterium]MBR4678414.1 caspase family protein [Bacteroidales bacterium]
MTLIRYISTLLIIITSFCAAVGQGKVAFLVGISDYPAASGFGKIHGAEDADMMAKTLEKQDFRISKITNSQTTAQNIREALDSFIIALKSGDYIYLHFSCHGQPVEDLPPYDEEDSWDEAIVAYDAQINYQSGVYEGENHILDDELGKYFTEIRRKIGAGGFLCVVIDACHSGNSSRDDDDDEKILRGTKTGFSMSGKNFSPRIDKNSNFIIAKENGLSDILILEACRSYQNNFEINVNGKHYGPLSYYFNETLENHDFTKVKEWFSIVKNKMDDDHQIQNQNMVYEKSF